MMDAEAVANRSSYWKLAAALQSFLLLLQKKRLGKENKPLVMRFRRHDKGQCWSMKP